MNNEQVEINVKLATEEILSFHLPITTTIYDLKEILKSQLQLKEVHLLFNGKLLNDSLELVTLHRSTLFMIPADEESEIFPLIKDDIVATPVESHWDKIPWIYVLFTILLCIKLYIY